METAFTVVKAVSQVSSKRQCEKLERIFSL